MPDQLKLVVYGILTIIDYEEEVVVIPNTVPKEQQTRIGMYLKAEGFILPPVQK